MKKVRLFGLSASGTCFLHYVLEKNYYVKILQDGEHDKHQKYTISPTHGELDCVLIIKSLPAWVASIRRYRKRRGSQDMTLSELCEWWLKANNAWLSIRLEKCTFYYVFYEPLLAKPELTASSVFKFPRRLNKFAVPAMKMRPMHGVEQSDTKFDKSYYAEKKYLKELSSAEQRVIKQYEDLLL